VLHSAAVGGFVAGDVGATLDLWGA